MIREGRVVLFRYQRVGQGCAEKAPAHLSTRALARQAKLGASFRVQVPVG